MGYNQQNQMNGPPSSIQSTLISSPSREPSNMSDTPSGFRPSRKHTYIILLNCIVTNETNQKGWWCK